MRGRPGSQELEAVLAPAGSASHDRKLDDAAVRATAAACCDLGRDSLLAGDVDEALWFLRQAVEMDEDNSSAWQLLGRCFEQRGEHPRARRCFSLAFRLFAKSREAGALAAHPVPIVWPGRAVQDS